MAESPEVSLGRVSWGESRAGSVTLHNSLDDSIKIVGVEVGCGCTDASAGRTAIPAGESTELVVRLEPSSEDGPVRKWVAVDYQVSGDASGQVIRLPLAVTAEIVPAYRVDPPVLLLRGEAAEAHELTLRPAGGVEVRGVRTMSATSGLTIREIDGAALLVEYQAGEAGPDPPALTLAVDYVVARGEVTTGLCFVPVEVTSGSQARSR